MDLSDNVALVTGATRGIGRAIAMELLHRGATVVGTATSAAGAESITAAIAEVGGSGEGWMLDVGDPAAVARCVDDVVNRYGTVSILVNNAAVTHDNLLLRMKGEEWDNILRINLTSAFHLCKVCIRGMMKARKGRIINIASIVGATGNAGQTNYAAAKAGLMGFTKSLAREVASRGITVNAVAPGFIDTDMTRNLPEPQRNALLQQIPLARLGQPQEIASAVAFLASTAAGYITGETLHVNGGMYMN